MNLCGPVVPVRLRAKKHENEHGRPPLSTWVSESTDPLPGQAPSRTELLHARSERDSRKSQLSWPPSSKTDEEPFARRVWWSRSTDTEVRSMTELSGSVCKGAAAAGDGHAPLITSSSRSVWRTRPMLSWSMTRLPSATLTASSESPRTSSSADITAIWISQGRPNPPGQTRTGPGVMIAEDLVTAARHIHHLCERNRT